LATSKIFDHPDVAISRIEIEIVEELERVLVIETPLTLWPMAEGYDEARVSDLVAFAQAFRADRRNGIDKVRVVSIHKG
jgi:hypothetical protein